MRYLYIGILSILTASSSAASFGTCPLAGPSFFAPTSPSTSEAIHHARKAIQDAFDIAIKNGTTPFGDVGTKTTSFSVGIFSAHEDNPFFTFNHDAPDLPKPEIGVSTVDSNTIYRIGSISKLLTVYIYLASVGDISFNDPVTKYIPEFAQYAKDHNVKDSTLETWDFDSMTVGSLATQLSGLPRETTSAFFSEELTKGLPKVPQPPPNVTGADCPNSYHMPCSRELFFENLLNETPVSPAFMRPLYSNVAYGILGMVLESITGQALPDIFESQLVKPLGLNATYYSAPPTPEQGIVPYNNSISFWTTDIRNMSAAGNYYSSVNDMAKIGKSILNSDLLSQAVTRRWIKPATFGDNIHTAVGAPWEIYQGASTNGKTNWIFTKQGDIGTYSTTLAILPDQEIGFTVLTAGLDSYHVNQYISDIIAENIVPAIEQAAREEAQVKSAGTYHDETTNSTVVLAVDERPGIAVPTWTANGTDMKVFLADALSVPAAYLRLYPSGLKSDDGSEIGYTLVPYSTDEKKDPGDFTQNCVEWFSVAALQYGATSLDSFSLKIDSEGKAVSVQPRGFRQSLPRV